MGEKEVFRACTEYFFNDSDILPLVEFRLDEDLTEEEAIRIINTEREPKLMASRQDEQSSDKWNEERSSDYRVLKLEDSSVNESYKAENYHGKLMMEDPFTERMASYQDVDLEYQPITVNKELLQQTKSPDVILAQWPPPPKAKFFRNLMSGISITKCNSCLRVSSLNLAENF